MALAPFKAARELMDRLLGRAEAGEEQDETEIFLPGPPAPVVESDEAAARIAQELLRDTETKVQELPPGQQFVVSFAAAAEHYGERWPTLIGRAKILSERVLKRRLGEFVAYREDDDDGLTFVILDTDIVDEDIEPLGEDIVAEILRQLTGGQDQDEFEPRRKSQPDVPEAAQAEKTEAVAPVGPAIRSTGEPEQAAGQQADLGFVAPAEDADFSGGWEFAEGPETVNKAEYEYSFSDEDQPVPVSGDLADAALDIPTADTRPKTGWEIAPSDTIGDETPAVPTSDAIEDAPPGEFSSEPDSDQAYDAGRSDDRETEQPRLDFGADPIVEEAVVAPSFSLADTLKALAESRPRTEDPIAVPESGDRETAEAAIPISGDEPEPQLDVPESTDLPEPSSDVPLSEAREEADADFAASADLPETEVDVPVSGDIADEVATFEPSDERAEPETGSFESADFDEPGEPDVALSDTKPEEEQSFEASPDTPDGTFEIPASGELEEPETVVPLSGDRNETESEFGLSDTLAEDAPVLVESGERAEIAAETPTSEDRPEEGFGVPTSEDRVEAEFETPISEDRAEEELAVPISGERAEEETDIPTSEDREERDFEVPISEDRVEAETVLVTSSDRDEPEFEVAESETRAERETEFEVERTETKAERSYDFGQSEDRVASEPQYEFIPTPERAAAELAVALVDAEPVPDYRLRLRYGAWLDTQADTVTTYVADPSNKGPDGTETPYHRLLAAGPPPERCFTLDCQMLRLAARDMAKVRADGGRLLLGLPVAASTLLRPKYRARYLQLWREVDEETRKLTRLTAYHLPQTSASQASDLFGWLRSLGRAPIVRIPPRYELLAPLAGLGVHGVSINYSKWHREMGEAAFVERLTRMVKLAKAAKLRLALINVPTRRAVQIGLACGCDYLEIAVLEGEADIPRRLAKINRAKLMAKES